MVRAIVIGALGVTLVAAIIAGLWYYRPWSPYSPAAVAALQQPDKLVHNFRSMDTIFPSRPVPAGDQVTAYDESTAAPLDITYQWQGETRRLSQFLEDSTTTGLLVTRGDQLLHESYYHDADAETRFTSWSVAKSFVATALFMALNDGLIGDLDDPAAKYAPQFAGTGFGDASLRHLLMMSSGVGFDEDYSDPDSDIQPYFFDTFILGRSPDELLKPFEQVRPPGETHHYISPNSQVLAAVVRGAHGNRPLPAIISEQIWRPLGMGGDAYWSVNSDGESGLALGYCCLNARLRDFARLGRFYLDAHHERGGARAELPDGIPEMLQHPATPAHRPGRDKYQGRGYSYHFWLPTEPAGAYFAAGIYGQYVWIHPARDIVIARTSADPEWTARTPESMTVMNAIAAHYAKAEGSDGRDQPGRGVVR